MAGVESASLFGESVHVLTGSDTGADFLESELGREGIEVLEQERIEPSLEDVFIHLVGRDVRSDAPGPGADHG
jgi:hypothetical protein